MTSINSLRWTINSLRWKEHRQVWTGLSQHMLNKTRILLNLNIRMKQGNIHGISLQRWRGFSLQRDWQGFWWRGFSLQRDWQGFWWRGFSLQRDWQGFWWRGFSLQRDWQGFWWRGLSLQRDWQGFWWRGFSLQRDWQGFWWRGFSLQRDWQGFWWRGSLYRETMNEILMIKQRSKLWYQKQFIALILENYLASSAEPFQLTTNFFTTCYTQQQNSCSVLTTRIYIKFIYK